MHAAAEAGLQSADIAKKLSDLGVRFEKMGRAEFGRLMLAEQNKWLKVIKAADIRDE
jgi:hypothetical protein